jgi:hypothetical protein
MKTTSLLKGMGFPRVVETSENQMKCVHYAKFNEETGVHCMADSTLLYRFRRVFVGSNGISYKHKYYLVDSLNPMAGNAGDHETQAKEISCTKWMTFEEVDKVVASASRRYVMRAANLETLKLMTCGGCVHKPSGYPSY